MEWREFSSDEAIEAAQQRGELRLRLTAIDDPVPDTMINRYADCQQAYADLTANHNQAQQALFAIMGMPEKHVHSQEPHDHTAWYQDERTIVKEGAPVTVPVAYQVCAHVQEGSLCRGANRYNKPSWVWQPLAIRTHVIHRASGSEDNARETRLSGVMSEYVLFEADATYVALEEKEVQLASFQDIKAGVIAELVTAGRKTALEPWADKLVALPDGMDEDKRLFTEYGEKYFGLTRETETASKAIASLLLKNFQSYQTALNALVEAFHSKNFPAIFTLLEQPYRSYTTELAKYPGAVEKSAWLLGNIVRIQKCVQEAISNQVAIHFHDVFKQKLAEEAVKTERIAFIVQALGRMQNITLYAPEAGGPETDS